MKHEFEIYVREKDQDYRLTTWGSNIQEKAITTAKKIMCVNRFNGVKIINGSNEIYKEER